MYSYWPFGLGWVGSLRTWEVRSLNAATWGLRGGHQRQANNNSNAAAFTCSSSLSLPLIAFQSYHQLSLLLSTSQRIISKLIAEMDGGKKPTGSSSIADELFGRKDGGRSSQSGLFGSIFPTPSSVSISSSLWFCFLKGFKFQIIYLMSCFWV